MGIKFDGEGISEGASDINIFKKLRPKFAFLGANDDIGFVAVFFRFNLNRFNEQMVSVKPLVGRNLNQQLFILLSLKLVDK